MTNEGLGTLAELAEMVGGRVVGDPKTPIDRIAAIPEAFPGALTFAVDERYLRAALKSRASAIMADEKAAIGLTDETKPLLLVPSARAALAKLLTLLDRPVERCAYRDPTASVAPTAQIGDGVWIGPSVFIGEGAVIGARSRFEAGSFVGAQAQVGAECTLGPGARLFDRCVMGDRVVLYAGATIGADGFGFVFVDGKFVKIPQVGNVRLGDDVEIGANTCIDRGQTGSTVIGRGTKIDNLVQIGHNCRIGENCVLAAQTGLAGSTVVGDYVRMGGRTATVGHITVGSRVTIGGGAVLWASVPDDAFVSGVPAQNHRDELRQQVHIRGLPKLLARVDALETRLRAIDAPNESPR